MKTSYAQTHDQFEIAGYRLLEILGEGASSVVYRGYSLGDPSKPVAIKLSKTKWDLEHIESRTRFENEAELLSRLSHPNIVRLIQFGFSAEHPYLVMEHVQGVPLQEEKSSVVQVVEILKQIAGALTHAHGKGILHRDIKPSNILLARDGDKIQVKLLDFGLSGSMGRKVADLGLGSLLYSSPEQLGILPHSADECSDLYSLGMLGIELLIGNHPFAKMAARELLDAQANLMPHFPESAPQGLVAILETLVKKDPAQRYQTAKGLIADLQTFSGRWARGFRAPFELRTQDRRQGLGAPKFLGRAEEREALSRAFDRSKTEGMQIVALRGLSGMGKSRLISELTRKWIKSHNLWGIASAYGQASAYGLFAEALRDLPALNMTMDSRLAIREAIGELGGEIVNLVPELKSFVGANLVVAELEPERRQQRFFSVMTELLRVLASRESPLVLILDDIQWSDEGSLQLILHLARHGREIPMLMVLAYRAEEATPDTRAGQFLQQLQNFHAPSEVSLGPLNDEEIRVLTFSMLGRQIPEVDQLIISQANGSPLYAVELLHALVEADALVAGETGWEVRDLQALNSLALNDSLVGTIIDRMERLSPETTAILEISAVIGRVFRFDLLLATLLAEGRTTREQGARLLMESLREAEGARLVAHVSEDGAYEFSHDKIREAIYERMPKPTREALHLRVGLALEGTLDTNPENGYAVAHHFLSAADGERARYYAVKAGDLSRQHHAYREAIDFYERALRREPEREFIDEHQELYVLEAIGDAASMTGDYDRALQNYDQVLARVSEGPAEIRILGKQGRTLFSKGEAVRAGQALQKALRAQGESIPSSSVGLLFATIKGSLIQTWRHWFPVRIPVSNDPEKQAVGRLYSQLSYVYYFTDTLGAMAIHLQHLNYLERHNVASELGQAYSNHGPGLATLPWFKRGVKFCRRGLALRESLGDRWGIAQSRHFLALTLCSEGRWVEALGEGLLAESEFQKLGDRWELATLTVNIAYMYAHLGQWETAEAYAAKTYKIASEINHSTGLSYVGWVRAEFASSLDCNRLLEQIEVSLAAVLKAGDVFAGCQSIVGKGRTLLNLGRFQEAENAFDFGLGLMSKHLLRTDYLMGMYAGKVDAILRRYETTADEPSRRSLLKLAQRHVRIARWAAGPFPNHRAYLLRMRALVAAYQGKMSKAEKFWQKALAVATAQHYRYEIALTLKDWGLAVLASDKLRAQNMLAQAAQILAELNAQADLKAIRPLIPAMLQSASSVKIGTSDLKLAGLSNRSLKGAVSTQRQLEALLQVGLASVSTGNSKDQMRFILDKVIKLLAAERAFLFIEKGGELIPVAGRSAGGADLPELVGYSASVARSAFQSSEAVIVTGTEQGPASASQSILTNDLRSIISVPLKLRNVVTGVLYLDSSLSQGLFAMDDAQILTVIASNIAISVEAAQMADIEAQRREMAKDLEVSAAVQKMFLPQETFVESEHFKLAYKYLPAAQCGGDWLWYRNDGDRLGVFVGDVTGHGAGPAMVTAYFASAWEILASNLQPENFKNVLESCNLAFAKFADGQYMMTGLAMIFEFKTKKLTSWSMGAPSAILIEPGGKAKQISRGGGLLGFRELQVETDERIIQNGSRIILASDGIVDARLKNGRELGEFRFNRILDSLQATPLAEIPEKIFSDLKAESATQLQEDDCTMLVIETRS